ncbi:MAG: DUF2612 domain-containing protein [Rhodospirillaceae bacterium]|nr:DUF2612 domain-containing protein [Rhodospirillaceae bacterium]
MKNWRETILSQYANSPRLLALIEAFDARVDPEAGIDAFYQAVFDPRQARDWGLDVWGKIVDIERTIGVEQSSRTFGFQGSGLQPFGQGSFVLDQAGSAFSLSDEPYRKLIFFKAGINISDGSMRSLNAIIHTMFEDRGAAMVVRTGTMKIRFLFDFYLKPYESALIRRDDVPPKPAGVGFDVYQVKRAETFGFAGSGLQPFGQGNFVKGAPEDAYSVDA